MAKPKISSLAIGFSCIAFFCVFLAFVSSSWLVTDGELQNPKFERLGLWFACFRNLTDTRHLYDTVFKDCWWVYEEEYYIIHDLLLPGFYVATQFFFTICFILSIIGCFLMLVYLCTSKDDENFECLLTILGLDLVTAALSGTIAVILFGSYGDSRVWMPNWEHNNMGWSYVSAVIGTGALYVSGILYLIESRVHRIRHRRFTGGPSDYDMQERKRYGHSDF